MGLIPHIPSHWRDRAALYALRLRYWWLDTEEGKRAHVWAFGASVVVLVVQLVRLVVAGLYPPPRHEPAHAIIWWVVQLIIAIIMAIISRPIRTS
jgi:hypothetical protein